MAKYITTKNIANFLITILANKRKKLSLTIFGLIFTYIDRFNKYNYSIF